MPYASLTPPCKLLLTYNLHSTYHLYQFYLSSSLLCVIWHIRPYFYHVKSLKQDFTCNYFRGKYHFHSKLWSGTNWWRICHWNHRKEVHILVPSTVHFFAFPLPLWPIFHAVLCMKLFYYNTCTWCMTTDYFQHCNLLNNREWNVGKLY